MKRREFLKTMQSLMLLGALGSIPGLTLIPSLAKADGPGSVGRKRFFLMIRLSPGSGGMDATLGLDPKTHARQGSDESDMFIEYRPDEILSASGIFLGPAAAPMIPYANNIAVINGIFMSDSNVSHDANADYMSTGDSMGQSADMPVEIANATQAGAFGIVFNQSLKRANRAIMPTTLQNLLSMRDSINLDGMQSFLAKLKNKNEFYNSEMNLIKNSPARARLLKSMDSLSSQIGTSTYINNDVASTDQSGAIVAAAFSSEAAYQAQLDLSVYLDTHSGHPGLHLKNQTSAWAGVAKIFEIFKNVPVNDDQGKNLGSLFDFTTFAVISDFSRTPALNASRGKDHNPETNSILLAGAGIHGGQSVGISQLVLRKNSSTGESRHTGGLIDYSTGQAAQSLDQAKASNFQFVYPENVAATIAEIMNIDRKLFANVSPDIPHLKTLVKS